MQRLAGTRHRVIATFGLVLCLFSVSCSAATEDAEAPPATLRVLMSDDWVTPAFLDAVRDFEQTRKNVRVVVDKTAFRGNLNYVKGLDPAERPDVVQAHAYTAAAGGLAQPLDDLWAKHLTPSEFFPGSVEDATWEGRRYGVPLDTNVVILLYNADRFEETGTPLPTAKMTFSDFEEIARRVSSPDGSRRAIAFGTSTWRVFGWVAANGGEFVRFTPDGKPELLLDSPRVVQSVTFLSDLVRQGLAFPPRAAETSSGDIYALFESGVTAMHATGAWDAVKLRKSRPDVDYRAVTMPTGYSTTTPGSAMGGSSLFVPQGSPNRALAFEFMLHLISDRHALRLAKDEGRLPVRERLYSNELFQDPSLQVAAAQLRTARLERLDAYPESVAALRRALDQILRENADPLPSLRQAQESARVSLGSS